MLVLERSPGQMLLFKGSTGDEPMRVRLLEVRGNRIVLGIEGAESMVVWRAELGPEYFNDQQRKRRGKSA